MKRQYTLPAVTILGGVLAAFIRVWERQNALEPSGLIIPGHPAAWTLRVFAVGFVVLLFVITRKRSPAPDSFPGAINQAGVVHLVLVVASSILLLASAALSLGGLRDNLFAALTVVTALGISVTVRYRRERLNDLAGLCLVAPLFWGCFWVILSYNRHGVNPVRADFIYEQFAMLTVLLALCGFAAFSYGRAKTSNAVFYALAASFLIILSLGGLALSELIYGSMPAYIPESAVPDLPARLRLASMALYLLTMSSALSAGQVASGAGKRVKA
jgi:hypothetical protein